MAVSLNKILTNLDEITVAYPNGFTIDEAMVHSACSRSSLSTVLPALVRKEYLKVLPLTKPYKYIKATDRALLELYNDNLLSDLWQRKGTSDTHNKNVTKVEPPPEEIEIDPIELLEQLTDVDFGSLISSYISRKNAELDPLKDQVKDLQTRLMIATSNNDTDTSKLRHDVDGLRRELRDEREKIIHLRNELQSAQNKLFNKEKEAKVKLIMVNKPQNNNKQHGSVSNVRATVVVHRKPLATHAPSSVLTRKGDEQ